MTGTRGDGQRAVTGTRGGRQQVAIETMRPEWCETERRLIEPVCAAIDAVRLPRRTAHGGSLELRVSGAEAYRSENAGGSNIVFTRHLYNALGFDEHRVPGWRIEHKLVQALVIDRYRPGAMPVTRGLGRLRASGGGSELARTLATLFPAGYYAKRTLGDSSGGRLDSDQTRHRVEWAASFPAPEIAALIDEREIVQERVPIAREYRVQSFEDRVVPALTFRRYSGAPVDDAGPPEAFVQSVLDALPAGLVGGTLHAWDVALTEDGLCAVIEVNVAGFHSDFARGFQCSGFFHNPRWGPICAARLVHFLETAAGIEIAVVADRRDRPENAFYAKVAELRTKLRPAALPCEAQPA